MGLIGFAVTIGDVSVSPYPSVIGNPMPAKNCATSTGSGALPDTRQRSRPPTLCRIFENTRRSAIADSSARIPPTGRSGKPARPRARATLMPQ
jgi:hypothetical protein